MFEAAELGRKVSKKEYKERLPQLRVDLLTQQYELREADFSVVVVVAGDDRAGAYELLNRLHEWMDARYLETHAFGGPPTDEERERPRFWRYWRALPAKGRIGIFVRGWSVQAIVERLTRLIDEAELRRIVEHIRRFEKALADDGTVVLKLWLHLPEALLKKRLQEAAGNGKRAGHFYEQDQQIYKSYERGRRVVEEVLRQTSTGEAPWHIIESTDDRYRDLAVARILLEALSKRLQGKPKLEVSKSVAGVMPEISSADSLTILDKIDLSLTLAKEDYDKQLKRWQTKLHRFTDRAHEKGISSILVVEGWDASGKGGAIRRLTAAIDAPLYRVIPITAPTDEELAHHYLWRFWRQLPRAGHMVIFDRSWYGRVLVERLEGFASEREWKRAYSEINDFEEQLCEHGIVLIKLWIHIDPEEQLRRFRQREQVPFKKYKITAEDYRNRERWNEYELAANEMIQRTSTEYAPWNLVAGNHKRWARVQVLKRVCKQLKGAV